MNIKLTTKNNMKKKFFIFLAFIVLTLNSNAQVILTSFQIRPDYVTNNQLNVTNINGPTAFKFAYQLQRGIISTGGFKSGTCSISLIYTEAQSGDSSIGSDPSTIVLHSKNITSSDYNDELAKFLDIDASLPANKLNGKILLRYIYVDDSNQSQVVNYSTTRYSIRQVIENPPAYTPPVPGAVPLYEYFVPSTGIHSYSTQYSASNYVGILGYVFNTQVAGTVPLYKMAGAVLGENYYTVNAGGNTDDKLICYVYITQITKTLPVHEHWSKTAKDYLLFCGPGTFGGYERPDNPQFYILQNPQPTTYALPEEDTMELYEYYSTSKGEHFYTTLKKDRPDYYYSKVLGYVYSIQKAGSVPLYRYVNPTIPSGNHYYTINKQNYAGYTYEGIVGYVYNNGNTSGTTPVYEYYNSSVVNHYYNTINSSFAGYSNEGIKFYMLPYSH